MTYPTAYGAALALVLGNSAALASYGFPSPAAPDRELVFIAPDVPDLAGLLPALRPGVETVLLEAGRDPIEQMVEHAALRRDLAAIHLISHGEAGALKLGDTILDAASVLRYRSALARIGMALKPGGDLLLYGCDVAREERGRQFIRLLSEAMGADVAASTDVTTSRATVGNWALEAATGPIAAAGAVVPERARDYQGSLATLQSGDIAIIGFTLLNTGTYANTIRFVPLVNLPAGTVLGLTDRGWINTNRFNTNLDDGTVTWTLGSPIAAGTVMRLQLNGLLNKAILVNESTNTNLTSELTIADASSWSLALDALEGDGDNFFIFQDSPSNPYFIAGINATVQPNLICTLLGNQWCDFSTDLLSLGSRLPNGTGSQNALTNGVNAMGGLPISLLAPNGFFHYVGPITTTDRNGWLNRFVTLGNWAWDGTGTLIPSVAAGTTLNFTVANTAPSLSLDTGSLAYTENGGAAAVSPGATASDAQGNWNGGSLSVSISANASSDDSLSVGAGTGLTVAGTSVSDGGTGFATLNVSGGTVTGGTTLSAVFNASATNAMVQKLVQAIAFANGSDTPSTATRTVDFTLLDGAAASVNANRTITVSEVNDAPTISASGTVSAVQGVAIPVTGISFADVDAGAGTMTLTLVPVTGTLSAASGSGVTVSGSGTALLALSGTLSDLNSFIAASRVSYDPILDANGNVSITVTVNDGGNTGSGGALSASGTTTIAIAPVVDTPQITSPTNIGITPNVASPVTGVSISAADAGSAPVTVTFSVPAGAGTFSANSGGGVTATGSGSNSIDLTGTVSAINALLAGNGLLYTATGSAGTALSIALNAGNGQTTSSTGSTLAPASPNQPPTITAPASLTAQEDVATGLVGISFADPDAATGPITAQFTVPSGTLTAASEAGVVVLGSGSGTVSLTGALATLNAYLATGKLRFTTAQHATTAVVMTIGVSDNGNTGSGGAKTASGSSQINITAINDAPTIAAPTTLSVLTGSDVPLRNLSFSDIDAANAPLTVTLGVSAGVLKAVASAGVTVAGSGSASLTLAGTQANLNAFITADKLTFRYELGVPTRPATVTLSIGLDDGGSTGADPGLTGGASSEAAQASVTMTLIEGTPQGTVVVPAGGSVTVTNGSATVSIGIQGTAVFPDSNATVGKTIELTNTSNGVLSLGTTQVKVASPDSKATLSISYQDDKPVIQVKSGTASIDSGSARVPIEAAGLRILPGSQGGLVNISMSEAGVPTINLPAGATVQAANRDVANGAKFVLASGGPAQINVAGRQLQVESLTTQSKFSLASMGDGAGVVVSEGMVRLTTTPDAQSQPLTRYGNQTIWSANLCGTQVLVGSQTSGRSVTVLKCTIRLVGDNAAELLVYSGETLTFDSQDRVLDVLLGSSAADMGFLGDSKMPSDASLRFADTIPSMTGGTPNRPGRYTETLDQRYLGLANRLFGVNWSVTGQSNEGVFRMLVGDQLLNAVPLGRIKAAQSKGDGITAGPEGTFQLTVDGFTTRFGPTLTSPLEFAKLLARDLPGTVTTQRANGNYLVQLGNGGALYEGRPSWGLTPNVSAPQGFSVAGGLVTYTNSLKEQQIIYPTFHDQDALLAAARRVDPEAVATHNIDGTTVVLMQGRSYLLTPLYEIVKLPAGRENTDLWMENGLVFLRNSDNTAQAFIVH